MSTSLPHSLSSLGRAAECVWLESEQGLDEAHVLSRSAPLRLWLQQGKTYSN